MPDWLIKVFEYKIPNKTAFIILLTAILTITSWKDGLSYIQSYSLSLSYAQYSLPVICYCVSIIIINSSYSISIKSKNILTHTYNHIIDRYKFSSRLIELLPHISKYEILLLLDMEKHDKTLINDDRQTQSLLKYNLIYKSQPISEKTSIYKTNKQLKHHLPKFIKNEQKKYLEKLFIKNDEDILSFLSLFYDAKIKFGTQESDQRMPYHIYISAQTLIDQYILTKKISSDTQEKSSIIQFELDPYAAKLISKIIFHKRPVRNLLELNLHYVSGSGATGGGAHGSKYQF